MLAGLDEMHTRHIQSFNEGEGPDIEQQTLEREKAFSQFKNEMSTFIQTCSEMADQDKAESMLNEFKDHVHSLLKKNETLTVKVKENKEHILSRMNSMSKGRRAINLYGSSSAAKNKPRVISLTN